MNIIKMKHGAGVPPVYEATTAPMGLQPYEMGFNTTDTLVYINDGQACVPVGFGKFIGEKGWVDLREGTFNYQSASGGTGISWDGSTLNIRPNSITIDEVTANVSAYMTFNSGGLYVGKGDSAIKTRMSNDAFSIVTGEIGKETELAKFTQEALEVKNVRTDNQVDFFDDWAIRKGAYVEGVGYNLNDMWIGG